MKMQCPRCLSSMFEPNFVAVATVPAGYRVEGTVPTAQHQVSCEFCVNLDVHKYISSNGAGFILTAQKPERMQLGRTTSGAIGQQ